MSDEPFPRLVAEELVLRRAQVRHPLTLDDAMADLLRRAVALFEQTRHDPGLRSRPAILRELIQVGVLAQRTAEDLGLVPEGPR